MEFVELSEDEFLDFSKNSPITSFFQDPHWAHVKEENGWGHYYVGMKDNNSVVAATLLLYKRIKFFKNMFYAPRGFLIDYNNFDLLEKFTFGIKDFLKDKDALFLKINPYVDYQERDVDGNIILNTQNNELMDKLNNLGFVHNGFYIDMDSKIDLEPRWISVLDLDNINNIDDAVKNMRSGVRYGINNSRKNSLEIIDASIDDLEEFKNLMKHTAERRGFVDRPLSYYKNMFNILKKDNLVKVLLVKINFKDFLNNTLKNISDLEEKIKENLENVHKQKQIKEFESEIDSLKKRASSLEEMITKYGDSKIIAGGWYMLYGREVVYLFGASYKEFMKYNSQYYLQYEMIKYAIDNGYSAFNFYGIDGNFSKDSSGYGLFDFKRGFNACVHELIGEFDLIIDKKRYSLYKLSFSLYKTIKKVFNK